MRWMWSFAVLLVLGCSKSTAPDTHTLVVDVYHHVEKVPFTKVYLKEDASDFPGWSRAGYDFVGVSDIEARTTFEGLLPGTHYMLGLGFDGQDSVKGYQTVTIDSRDADRKQKVILYVTE